VPCDKAISARSSHPLPTLAFLKTINSSYNAPLYSLSF
jgi:hypothetical protein